MKALILYWFSGTGNTWLAAQALAEALRKGGVTVTLRRLEAAAPVALDPETALGVAFPVACFSTYPLVWRFLERLPHLDEAACHQLAERLSEACGGRTPVVWDNRLNAAEAPAAWQALMHDQPIRVGDLLIDGTERSRRLPVVPLMIERGDACRLLPDDDEALQAGDQLLFASPLSAQRNLELTLRNANELEYVLHGHEKSGSLLGKLLAAH